MGKASTNRQMDSPNYRKYRGGEKEEKPEEFFI